jgi:dienelactone hydrolase
MMPQELVVSVEEKTSLAKGFNTLRLHTERGSIEVRLYPAEQPRGAVIMVGGVGGGWDTPARGLYPRLARELSAAHIAVLRVRYRNPRNLEEATFDVRVGAAFLRQRHTRALGFVGHSLGGAAVIRAADGIAEARTVVALATQSVGAEAARRLGPRCSLLLVHGTADDILPASSSQAVYAMAREPRQLVFIPGAGHVLDEAADQVYTTVAHWLRTAFRQTSRREGDRGPRTPAQ